MGLFGDIFGGLTDIFGRHPGDEYERRFNDLQNQFGAINPNLAPEQMGRSEMFNEDPRARDASYGLMNQYLDISRKGGLDPIAQSQVAEGSAKAQQGIDQSTNAIAARARAGGMNSGVIPYLQMSAGQGNADRSYMGGLNAAAGAQGRQMAAMGAGANLADTIRGRNFQQLSAQDAINEFNTRLRQGTNEGNFARQMNRLGGMGDAMSAAYGAAKGSTDQLRRGFSSIGSGIDQGGEMLGRGLKGKSFADALYETPPQ